MVSLRNFLKKKKLRKSIDSIATLNNDNLDTIDELEPIPEIDADTLQKPLMDESSKSTSKKVNINITLNLNVKESDAEKIINILDSYF